MGTGFGRMGCPDELQSSAGINALFFTISELRCFGSTKMV